MQIINPQRITGPIEEPDIIQDETKIFFNKEIFEGVLKTNSEVKKGFDSFIERLHFESEALKPYKTVKNEKNRGWNITKISKSYRVFWISYRSELNQKNPLKKNEFYIRSVLSHKESDLIHTLNKSKSKKITLGDKKNWSLFENPVVTSDYQQTIEVATDVDSEAFVIKGKPGSGKTTSLKLRTKYVPKAKKLHLTFNNELKDNLSETYKDEIKEGTLTAFSFEEFYNTISDKQLKTQLDPYIAVEKFKKAVSNFYGASRKDKLDAWKGREELLYSELHSEVFGREIPKNLELQGLKLENFYVDIKSNVNDIDFTTIDSTTEKILKHCIKENINLDGLFPGPRTALKLFKPFTEPVPKIYSDIEEIHIDECQDLTFTEILLVINFHSRLECERETKVKLVIAGDESQTIRPTNFKWKNFTNLFYQLGIETNEVNLDGNKRSSSKVVTILDSLHNTRSNLIPKELLPKGIKKDFLTTQIDKNLEGNILYCQTESKKDLEQIIEYFDSQDSSQLIHPTFLLDKEFKSYGSSVLSSGRAKGLEFTDIGVINISSVITNLNKIHRKSTKNNVIYLQVRSILDTINVAFSRAIENIIFIDENPDGFKIIKEFLEINHTSKVSIEPISLLELENYLLVEKDPEQKILKLIERSKKNLVSGKSDLALQDFKNAYAKKNRYKNTEIFSSELDELINEVGYEIYLEKLITSFENKNVRENYKDTLDFKKVEEFSNSNSFFEEIILFHLIRHESQIKVIEQFFNNENLSLQIDILDDIENSSSKDYQECIVSLDLYYERLSNVDFHFIEDEENVIKSLKLSKDNAVGHLTSGKLKDKGEIYQDQTIKAISKIGDFYFENKNYSSAIKVYEILSERERIDNLIAGKILEIYNLQKDFIKSSKYFEMLLKDKELVKILNKDTHLINNAVIGARQTANFKLLQKIQDNKFTHDNLNDVKNLLKLNKAINNKKVKLTQTELKAFDSLLKS